MKQKERYEVEDIYKWDLTKIYKNDKELNDDIKKVKTCAEETAKYNNKLLESKDNLLNAITKYNETTRILDKLIVYSTMKYHEDMSISKNKTLCDKIGKLTDEISYKTAFFVPELLKGDLKDILKFEEECKELKKYHFTFEEIFREKEHALSLKEEELLSQMGEIFTSSSNIYEMLDDVDIKFKDIHNENNELVTLSSSNYSKYLKSYDRNVRKEAFTNFYNAYDNLKHTYAETLKGSVSSDNFIAKIRKYDNCLQMSLFSDNIPTKLYDKLIEKVNNRLDIVYDYIKLRKDILKIDELHMYDIYVPLVPDINNKYTYEEAVNLVIKALSPLGKTYIEDLKNIINSNCIDVFNNKNKRGGAYSWGSYDTLPYVLLNFENDFYSVSTLAHELGHSMHSYYSHKNNEYHNSSYTIFLAEIASTVNEILLNKYMYENSQTKEEKLYYLNNLLEDFRTTLIRQTMFAEFEKIIHEKEENGEILTEEVLSDTYLSLNKKYYGSDIISDDLIKLEWARISHFYNSFYVYKYSTGISIACKIISDILSNKENALNNYLEFLKSGGRTYSLDILKNVGIDIVNDDTIDKALDMFKDTLEEFKKVYYE